MTLRVTIAAAVVSGAACAQRRGVEDTDAAMMGDAGSDDTGAGGRRGSGGGGASGGATGGMTAGSGGGPGGSSAVVGSGGVPSVGSGGTPPVGSGGAVSVGSGGTASIGSGGLGGGGSGGGPAGSGGGSSPDAGTDGPRPAKLALAPGVTGSHDFGNVEIGVATAATTFTLTNQGEASTGAPMLNNSNPNEVTATGCSSAIGAGASCTLSVVFRAGATGGPRTGTLTLTATPGGVVTLQVTATALYRVTITLTGTGVVTSTPAGLTCGTTCTGLFAPGVVLHARPQPGQRFTGWTGGGCPGDVTRDCGVALGASATVGATFVAATDNLAFITSAAFPTNLGTPASYDDRCNAAATAAGDNDSSGKAFVAVVASSTSQVSARLGSARGWVRLDGKPVFDTWSTAFGAQRQVWYPVLLDETGKPIVDDYPFVMTGLGVDGSASANNCGNWSGSGSVDGGMADAGPSEWVANTLTDCATAHRILCLGKTHSTVVKPATTTGGKKIWVTADAFTLGGGTTPDAFCQAARPSDVTAAVALLSTATKAASTILSSTTKYVRPDGVAVGTGAQIAAGTLESGVWQSADGTYPYGSFLAWAGSDRPGLMGTATSTCANWTDGSMGTFEARIGVANRVNAFWQARRSNYCNLMVSLYCVQTAP